MTDKLQEIKDQVTKEIKFYWPLTTYEYDGAGGSSCYVLQEYADEVSQRYASSECAAKDARIKELEDRDKELTDLLDYVMRAWGKGNKWGNPDLLSHVNSLLTPKDKQP